MDFNEVAELLHVHKAAAEHGSALAHIRDAALTRLKEIEAEAIEARKTQLPEPEVVIEHGEEIPDEPLPERRV